MSDDFFGDDEFDSAFLKEVDAIESASQPSTSKAAQASAGHVPTRPLQQPRPPPPPLRMDTSFSDFDTAFDVDSADLERLDEFIADSYAGKAHPVAGPSKLTRQSTLDGRALPQSPQKAQTTRSFERTKSTHSRTPLFGNKPQKTKQWDHTAFSETGWMSTKNKRIGKEKGREKEPVVDKNFDDDFDEEVEFEQFPAPYVNIGPPPPMRLKPDLLAAKDWIFPLNRPRRDYQFNIAKKCFFQNTLVALPTGLGKTFIAGVVMLNYYRWFPEGKIIFVAPTKPLVAQQISACHEVCGIPGRDAAELTGNVHKLKRSAAWAEKRVLYMTPQTLRNDLNGGLVDPLNIVLVVIDEAHKGTGDYAYAQVIRYMMAKNPHFRVLALTATPGNTPEAVQAIVDSLHISHIEIRNEQSYDLQKYIFKKEIRIHVIKMNEPVIKIRDLLCKLMDPLLKRFRQTNKLNIQSPVMLHPFTCQRVIRDITKEGESKRFSWAFGVAKVLGALSRAMGYLMESSSRMCFETLKGLKETLHGSDKPSDKQMRDILKNPIYLKLMDECERQQSMGFAPHPKMDSLLSLVLSHFANIEAEAETPGSGSTDSNTPPGDSKMMIFVQYRDCVDEIMKLLDRHKPMLRASHFIGQGLDKQGRKGLGQADQLMVIRKFKAGEFNILVSTSIGEEGLDIGEIDKIICYDSQKSSVRMLQRVGRTGRKRTGYVDVLLAEEREEKNWEKSNENYTDVQDTIISGNQVELYADVERLLPDNIQPECLQTTMEIEEYVPPSKSRESPAKGKKRKRNDDINRNVPLGAMMGFITASALQPKTKKAKLKPPRDSDLDEDSDDAKIAGGLCGPTSTPRKSKSKTSSKGKSKKVATNKSNAAQQTMKDYLKASIPDRLEEDDDDLDIQNGLTQLKCGIAQKKSSDSSDSGVSPVRPRKQLQKLAVSSSSCSDEPLAAARSRSSSAGTSKASSFKAALASPRSSGEKLGDWLLGAISDSDVEILPVSPRIKVDKPRSANGGVHFQSAKSHMRQMHSSDSPEAATVSTHLKVWVDDAAPPPLQGMDTNEGDSAMLSPEPTFAVRCPVKRKPVVPQAPPSSPTEERANAQRRIVRRRSPAIMAPPPIPDPQEKKSKQPKLKMTTNPMLFDVEAAHSGDEVTSGGSDVDMVESDSDRRFLEELEETQASPSYNQTQTYRMGLMTQAPAGVNMPRFASKPKRVGAFAGGSTHVLRPADWSSSPVRDSEPDEYDLGSFVVNDDDTILYDNSSEA